MKERMAQTHNGPTYLNINKNRLNHWFESKLDVKSLLLKKENNQK